MRKYLPWFILLAAISVSLSAAFYSVFGLAKLFSGAYKNVLIMASSLEFAKLVTTALLHTYWTDLNKSLRLYLTISVGILAIITSAGIYGYLSDAYQQTALKDKYHSELTNLVSTKKNRFELQLKDLKTERDLINTNIQTLSKSLSTDNQFQTVDKRGNVLTQIQSTKKTGVQNQLNSENLRRDQLNSRIDALQDSIQIYDIKIIESSASNDAASELGPLKYLSGLTGTPMDKVVNWFLLLLIFVFDPLAITLFIAFLKSLELRDLEVSNTNITEKTETQAELKLEPLHDELETIVATELEEIENTPLEKKKRGRPIGSKNKQKVVNEPAEILETVDEPVVEEKKEPSRIITEALTPDTAKRLSDSLPKPGGKKKV